MGAAIFRFVLSLVTATALVCIDPFQLYDSNVGDSTKVFHRLIAPGYPIRPRNESYSRDQIAVAVVSDATLDVLRHPWPLPYETWARILGKLLDTGPSAVFVDILFLRPPTPEDSSPTGHSRAMAAVIERYAATNVPLVFAEAAGTAGAVSTTVHVALGEAARTADVTAADNSFNLYRLRNPATPTHEPVVTPAGALFDSLCRVRRSARCPASAASVDGSDPLYIDWGIGADPAPTSPFPRVLRNAWEALVSPLNEKPLPPYHDVVPVGRLFRPAMVGELSVREMLHGRIVLLGAVLTGLDDSIDSPVLGRVAGVHAHAMALDNLLAYGSSYKRSSEDWTWTLNALAILAGVFALLLCEWRKYEDWGSWLVRVALYVGIVGIAYWLYANHGLAPVNVFGIVLVVELAHQAGKRLPLLAPAFFKIACCLDKDKRT